MCSRRTRAGAWGAVVEEEEEEEQEEEEFIRTLMDTSIHQSTEYPLTARALP